MSNNKPDEAKIIKIFQSKFGFGNRFVPDDIEYFGLRQKENIVYFKSDMLNEGTDTIPQMPLEHVGRKSIVSCVSDFASKGIRPRYGNIVVAIPSYYTLNHINKLSNGFGTAKKEFGITFLGGDVNEGKELGISVTLFGAENTGKKGTTSYHIRRSGAKKGDIIITTGPFGYTGSALKLIYDKKHRKSNMTKKSNKKFLDKLYYPMVNLEGLLRISKFFSSSMDSSDGLSVTLNELSEQSKKAFVIDSLPTTEEVARFAQYNGYDLEDLVLNAGDEYHTVATVSAKDMAGLSKLASKHGIQLYKIGKVTTPFKTTRKATKSGGMVYLNKNGKMGKVQRKGWVHLKKRK